MKLVRFSEIGEEDYQDYIEEWEKTGVRINPYASTRHGRKFSEIQEDWERDATDAVQEKGLVPATLYFLADDRGRLYGAIHFRHELNESLKHYGGHIGYGIRPSERRKGYADLQLKLMLEKIRSMGYKRVMLTCEIDNEGSARTIEKNGGILESIVRHDKGIGKRYWIEL